MRSSRIVLGLLTLGLAAWLGCGEQVAAPAQPPVTPLDTLDISLPGFPPMQVPADNPTTRQGVELGRKLFYDPILSGDGTQACASCHAQPAGFSDHGRRFSVGIDGIEGTRNAPALVNAGFLASLFWDGRAATLEAQALQPVPNPIEMHEPWPNAVAKLQQQPGYPGLFSTAFGSREISADRVVQAIAQFERTLVSRHSKYDSVVAHTASFTPSEHEGFAVFFTERGDCFHCHVDKTFTDQAFHNNGLDAPLRDLGLGAVSGNASDMGKFKTPTLRNIEFTAPYMHDGRFQTLEQVVEHYDSGGFGTPTVDPFIRVGRGLGLTPQEKLDLVAFLKTLSDSSFLTNPAYSNPTP